MAPVWGSAAPRTRNRISQPQWAGIHVASVPAVRASHGTYPVSHAPRSPESNGLAEAFFGSFKRDYVYQPCLETVEDVARQLLGWIEHYKHQAPHSVLGMQSPGECYAEWLVRNKTRPVQN